MKAVRLIFLCLCVLSGQWLRAQDLDPVEVYYTLELIPLTTGSDTSDTYQVVVVLDTADLDLYSTITVESPLASRDLKVSKEDRKDNPRIKLKDKNYHLDMEEWTGEEALVIKAKMLDGTKVKLKKHPRGSEFSHTVVTTKAETRDVKRYEGSGIVEEEDEQ